MIEVEVLTEEGRREGANDDVLLLIGREWLVADASTPSGGKIAAVSRAIVRYSFDRRGKRSRQAIRDALTEAGFRRVGTASYEVESEQLGTITNALMRALHVAGDPPDGRLDHIWIYVDAGISE